MFKMNLEIKLKVQTQRIFQDSMADWIKASIVGLIGIFAPVHAVMFSVGFLIVVDLISGVWAAKIANKKITSAGIRRTVTKLCVYQIVIMSGFLVEVYMLDKLIPVSKIAASIIGITELMSILENAEVIHGEPIFKKLIKKLGSDNDKDKD
jgi:phage-related holin